MHTWCPFGRSSATSLSPTTAPTMARQALRNEETEICSRFHKITFCFSKLKMNPYVRSNVASRCFFHIAQPTIVGTTFGMAWSVTPSVLDSYLVFNQGFFMRFYVQTWNFRNGRANLVSLELRIWWEKTDWISWKLNLKSHMKFSQQGKLIGQFGQVWQTTNGRRYHEPGLLWIEERWRPDRIIWLKEEIWDLFARFERCSENN